LVKGKGVAEDRKISGSYSRPVPSADHMKEPSKNALPNNRSVTPTNLNSTAEYLSTPRAPALTRTGSNTSEGSDSVIDLYATNRLSTMSGVTDILPNVNGSATAMYDLTGDIDNRVASSWIHRDKLMRIENQESRKSSPTPTETWVKTAQRKLSVDKMSQSRGSRWASQSGDLSRSNAHYDDDLPDEVFDNNEFDFFLNCLF